MFFCLIVWSAGFPTGVDNMGALENLMGGGGEGGGGETVKKYL